MSNNEVNFTINLNGNAFNGVVQLSNAVNQTLNLAMRESEVGNTCFWLNSIVDMVGHPVDIQPAVAGADAFETAMERVRKLAADQQRKGVIDDEIQIAGAQELARNVTQLGMSWARYGWYQAALGTARPGGAKDSKF